MRMCPCCKALTFEDMNRCYVCGNIFKVIEKDGVPQHLKNNITTASSSESTTATSGDFSSLGEVCEYGFDNDLFLEATPQTQDVWDVKVNPLGFASFDLQLSEGSQINIGRAINNDVVLHDLQVSRKHAQLSVHDGQVWVKDMNSKNLTIVDEVPVVGTRIVGDGAQIKIGSANIIVKSKTLQPHSLQLSLAEV